MYSRAFYPLFLVILLSCKFTNNTQSNLVNEVETKSERKAKNNSELVLKFNFDSNNFKDNEQRLINNQYIELDKESGLHNSNGIKVSYVGYEKGSKRVVERFKLPEPLDEATLNYVVKFDKNFQFRKGGKIHGLSPIKKIAAGKKMQTDGWSARAIFRTGEKIGSYIYHQNKPGKWGDIVTSEDSVFTLGKYSNVSIYVKVNSPYNKSNGIYELWVDGELTASKYNIQYRAAPGDDTLINLFIFETFHGGQHPGFAPRDKDGNFTTNYAWFDDIEIYKGKHIN